MTGILAIDTATEACSVAVYRDGDYHERHEVIPRQHNQRLFSMLQELLPKGDLRSQGIDAIAYGSGPGSFTGLRIAASAVQGLAYSNALPAVPVSTLAGQAQTALRSGVLGPADTVLSTLDARINEVYWALYRFEGGTARRLEGPVACAPGSIRTSFEGELCVVGSGCRMQEAFPADLAARLARTAPDLVPAARDLVPLALDLLNRGETQAAEQVQPVYVRDEISWKKLPEQGRPEQGRPEQGRPEQGRPEQGRPDKGRRE